jgi:hypothetical protein
MSKSTKELVEEITDYVNTYSNKSEEFNKELGHQHRTLQQSFTRLCLGWIEYVASNEYRTDARNEDSKAICMKMLHSFRREMAAEGYTQETLDLMSKPSGYCSHV